MITHPSRILNVPLYNEWLNLSIQNIKSSRALGNMSEYHKNKSRLVTIIKFMSSYGYSIDGSDTDENRFHFTYWGWIH